MLWQILLLIWFLSDFLRINWVLMVFYYAGFLVLFVHCTLLFLHVLVRCASIGNSPSFPLFPTLLNNNLLFIDLFKNGLFIYALIPVGLKFKFIIIGKNWNCLCICIMQVTEVGDFFFNWSIPLHCLNCRWCCRCFPILD